MVAKKKRSALGNRLVILLMCALISACCLVAWGFYNMTPILVSMAEARARQLAVEAMNQAIAEVMGTSITYADLMRVSTDSQGRVAMIEANSTLMNDISSEAALAAQRNLDTLADQGVQLPLGSALGISLLSGSGPEISSTQIRRLIGAGQDADALLPPPVARYIREKRLYLKQESGI